MSTGWVWWRQPGKMSGYCQFRWWHGRAQPQVVVSVARLSDPFAWVSFRSARRFACIQTVAMLQLVSQYKRSVVVAAESTT